MWMYILYLLWWTICKIGFLRYVGKLSSLFSACSSHATASPYFRFVFPVSSQLHTWNPYRIMRFTYSLHWVKEMYFNFKSWKGSCNKSGSCTKRPCQGWGKLGGFPCHKPEFWTSCFSSILILLLFWSQLEFILHLFIDFHGISLISLTPERT